jgi:hypothetical protein
MKCQMMVPDVFGLKACGGLAAYRITGNDAHIVGYVCSDHYLGPEGSMLRRRVADGSYIKTVRCPMCTPIPVPGCIECKGTLWVTEAEAGSILSILSRH